MPADESLFAWYGGIENADPTPSCSAFTLPPIFDRTYPTGDRLTDVLPAATGGVAPVTYSLAPAPPEGMTFDGATRTISGTPEAASPAALYTYTATDAGGAAVAVTFNITVREEPVAFPSTAVFTDRHYAVGRQIAAETLPAATGGEPPLTYSLAPTLPAGLSFDRTTRTLSGTPAAAAATTAYAYTATDAAGDAAAVAFNITVSDGLAFPSTAVFTDKTYEKDVTPELEVLPAAMGGVGALAYSLAPTLPEGLRFSRLTRSITGTPSRSSEPATYTYTAMDEAGSQASRTFVVQVEAPEDPAPTFGAAVIAERGYAEGETIEREALPKAMGGDPPLRYALTPALPDGLSFDASTRTLSGTPRRPSTRAAYTYTATDLDGDEASLRFGLTVEAAPPGGLITFTESVFVAREGQSAEFTVVRRGGAGRVVVAYETRSRSAGAGDFESVSGELEWKSGETGTQTVRVPLLTDGAVERSELFDLVLTVRSGSPSIRGPRAVAVIRDADAAACSDAPGAACLGEGRFRVETEWDSYLGDESGVASAQRVTDAAATMTFFDPENVELLVKVLDGRPINGRHWVFYAGLSDLEYWLIVTDTVQDRVRVYHNRRREICGRGDTAAFSDDGLAITLAAGAAWGASSSRAVASADLGVLGAEATTGDCAPGTLCLQNGRFEVAADWSVPNGRQGVAKPLAGTQAAGYLRFFSDDNIELAVKVLDGGGVNGFWWVYFVGLTDVDYLLTITDRQTGEYRFFTNPAPFCGEGDIWAFPKAP